MTTPTPNPDSQDAGISLPLFIAVAAVLIIGSFAVIWFAIPGADTTHVLAAPSGNKTIELAELCGPNGCSRVAVLDIVQSDDSHLRTYCPLERPETTPLFAQLTADWSSAEDSVALAFTTPDGTPGALTIQLADCTRTE